ncbi:MAG: glycosyltransferase family 9 protein [Deltaproteobacteria bacterium]|nr:glycosyltransferase family 9 protein [Deltaproteobacteria bacterium]
MKLPLKAHSLETPQRVCVLFPGALGDFICLLPALHHLARQAPLDVFARHAYADLVREEIRVYSIERPEIARLFVDGAAAEDRVGDFFACYRRVYSWTGSGQPVFREQLRLVAESDVYPFRPSQASQHQADYYFSCVAGAAAAPLPNIPLPPAALTWWHDYANEHGLGSRPLLVLAPGSGALEKNWPASSFAVVADWWRREKKGQVLMLLGPVEAERGSPDGSNMLVLRSPTLGQAAALLAHCESYLGNDSGMSHLAAAVGAPTVALFGPSDPSQWAPRGRAVEALSLHVECAPCSGPVMKSCPHRKCLTLLTPDMVIARLRQQTVIR